MDTSLASALLFIFGGAAIPPPASLWLLPKLERAAGRLSEYLDARKAR